MSRSTKRTPSCSQHLAQTQEALSRFGLPKLQTKLSSSPLLPKARQLSYFPALIMETTRWLLINRDWLDLCLQTNSKLNLSTRFQDFSKMKPLLARCSTPMESILLLGHQSEAFTLARSNLTLQESQSFLSGEVTTQLSMPVGSLLCNSQCSTQQDPSLLLLKTEQ